MPNHMLVYMSGICCHMQHSLQVVVLLCTILCTIVTQYYTVLQYLYFKPRMSGSKDKSSNEIASTDKTRQTVMIEKKKE